MRAKPSGRRRGRPPGSTPKLSPAVQDAILTALRIGLATKHAVEMQGIAERTFYDWMRKGELGIQPYRDFAVAVRRATAEGAKNLYTRALSGGPGAAQAAELLARRYPREYGFLRMSQPSDDPEVNDSLRMAERIRCNPLARSQLRGLMATLIADMTASPTRPRAKRQRNENA